MQLCAVISLTRCWWITLGISKLVTAESAGMVGMEFLKMNHMNEIFFFPCARACSEVTQHAPAQDSLYIQLQIACTMQSHTHAEADVPVALDC